MSFADVFGGAFDTHSVAPSEDYVTLPPGKYPVRIDGAEIAPTKAGDGHYLLLTLTVLDGPAINRKLFDRMNLDNPSEKAKEIAKRQCAALGQALGIAVVSDEKQFIGGIVIAHVKVKDGQNEIRTYSSAYAPPPDAVAAPVAPVASVAPAQTVYQQPTPQQHVPAPQQFSQTYVPTAPLAQPQPTAPQQAGAAPVPPWLRK